MILHASANTLVSSETTRFPVADPSGGCGGGKWNGLHKAARVAIYGHRRSALLPRSGHPGLPPLRLRFTGQCRTIEPPAWGHDNPHDRADSRRPASERLLRCLGREAAPIFRGPRFASLRTQLVQNLAMPACSSRRRRESETPTCPRAGSWERNFGLTWSAAKSGWHLFGLQDGLSGW